MAKGGYRKPANPAAVSGPGSLSRRTDGGPTQAAKEIPGGGKYGERKELAELQSGAAMQGNPVPNVPTPSVPADAAPPQQLTNLFAPTERPDEPITAGASFGPGYTPPQEVTGRYKLVSKYLPMLNEQASNPDVPDTFKNFVRFVNAANELDGIV
jgi:hypothetical protein